MNKPLVFTLALTAALLVGCANEPQRRAAPAEMTPARIYNATCTHGFDACHVKAAAACKKMGFAGHETVAKDDSWFGNNIDYTCKK